MWLGPREKGRVVGGDISAGAKIRQRPGHGPLGMKRAFLFLCRQREFCERLYAQEGYDLNYILERSM